MMPVAIQPQQPPILTQDVGKLVLLMLRERPRGEGASHDAEAHFSRREPLLARCVAQVVSIQPPALRLSIPAQLAPSRWPAAVLVITAFWLTADPERGRFPRTTFFTRHSVAVHRFLFLYSRDPLLAWTMANHSPMAVRAAFGHCPS